MDPNAQNNNAPTEAEIAETNEWDSAAKELFPGLDKTNEETTTTTTVETTQAPEDTTTTTTTEAPADDTTTTTTTVDPTTTTTTTVDPNETPEQKAEREKKEAEIAKEVEDNLPDTSAREARQTVREAQAEVAAVAKDVREKMFKDAPTELKDADGDPIRSIDDVMKLINPTTIGSKDHPNGRGFTQEEAGIWLLSAQQKFNQGVADMERRITQIAEVNVDLKDQADAVTYKYGELLKADTALRDRVWAEYQKTLVKDPDSGIITGMPVGLEAFYDTLLSPYVKLAENMENKSAEEKRVADEAAKAEEERKKKARADRSDIFGRGNVDDLTDPEDKEWAQAATAVFGPKKN